MCRVQILTTNSDNSTNEIIDWLRYYKRDVNIDRINEKHDLIDKFHSGKAVVYSRKYRHLLDSVTLENKIIDSERELNSHLQYLSGNELKVILEFYLKSVFKTVVGNEESCSENKLFQLETAERIGFRIPDTIVTNTKQELIEFVKTVESIIVKPLYNAIFYEYKKELFGSYTKKMDFKLIESLPEIFFPSIFQKEIKKKYEIRTFFFYGDCYSMCIFSQQSHQTNVDFRMYDKNRPNRMVPYNLKGEEAKLVNLFMQEMNLNTGSLDFIIGEDENTYFLEVNSEGQFGMVSEPCNYGIEEQISKKILKSLKLIDENNEN